MSESKGSIEEVRLCAEDDVPAREGKVVRVGDRPLAVFNTDEGFRVIDNTCTHMGGTLADGLVADASVACPLHERRFELATGRAVGHDCGSVGAYPVDVRDGVVYALVPVFDLGNGQAVVGGGSTDDDVTGNEGPDDDRETAPVETEERGEAPHGENSKDSEDPEPEGASEEAQTARNGNGDGNKSTEADRPVEAKAGLREPEPDET